MEPYREFTSQNMMCHGNFVLVPLHVRGMIALLTAGSFGQEAL